MLLAPLTKGSRQRMPEIVQMVKKGLDQCKADAKTRDMVWDAVYWSMGLICDLDEAHRALGDMLPVIHASRNYLSAKGQAFLEAYSAAQSEGPLAAARTLVLRQATGRFGARPGAADTLAAITAGGTGGVRPARVDRLRLVVPPREALTVCLPFCETWPGRGDSRACTAG